MHRHATIVTLNDLIRIFAVVSQANGADEDVLSAPRLGPIQQGILLEQGKNKNKNKKKTFQSSLQVKNLWMELSAEAAPKPLTEH